MFINIVFCPCYLFLLWNVVLKCFALCLITIIVARFLHLYACLTCLISSPIACPPSSVLCWCLLCFFLIFPIFVICYISLWLHFGLWFLCRFLHIVFVFIISHICHISWSLMALSSDTIIICSEWLFEIIHSCPLKLLFLGNESIWNIVLWWMLSMLLEDHHLVSRLIW